MNYENREEQSFAASGCVYSGSYAPPTHWDKFKRWVKGIDYVLEDYSNIIKVAGWPIAIVFATLYLLQ